MHKDKLAEYGLKRVANVSIQGNTLLIEELDAETVQLPGCNYAFTIDDEIVRVSSSSAPLKKRLGAWRRDVSVSLGGGKSATPLDEAERWRGTLGAGTDGAIYARQATVVSTSVGEFTAHLDEERVLIARYRPKLNRGSR